LTALRHAGPAFWLKRGSDYHGPATSILAMPVIRRFEPTDAAGVVDTILPIQQAEFGIPVTLADQPDLQDIQAHYRRGAGDFWVATAEGAVVGSIGLLDIGNGQGALRKMFVAQPWRGRAHGVAAALLQALLDHCRARGLHTVLLGTTDSFAAAHRFYEKHGFEAIDRGALPAAFPVMAVDTRFYRLTLRCADPSLPRLRSVELKAFVPARDFALSRRFYQDIGFTLASDSGGIAYFHHGECSFLLQDFHVEALAHNFMMHLLVEDVDAWHAQLQEARIAERYGVQLGEIELQPWRMRDFVLFDPSGVLWRIAQNVD